MSKYSNRELELLVQELCGYSAEQTWFEFKRDNDDPERIGKYISALSNCACAENQSFGYLVWGIDDETHAIVGTHFDPDTAKKGNQFLKLWLHTQLCPELSFEFYKAVIQGKDVVVLEIEAAYRQPVSFMKTAWGRIGESLVELSKLPKVTEQIFMTVGKDWSAETILEASCKDLDEGALKFAREKYAEEHKNDAFYSEIAEWDDITFLNKVKLAQDGKITRAAIILLGKPESTHYLNGGVAQITWNLLDSAGASLDYKHFGPPFLLAVDKVFEKIRNLTLRVMPKGTLFPVEIEQYDKWVFREALHNCIAHQNYARRCTIVVTEFSDRLTIANAGAFLPGTVENVLNSKTRPRFYPNKQLTEAMAELKMIDTIGSGIKRMFLTQWKRFMPLPDYEIGEGEVFVTLYGKILDERYTQLLMSQPTLSLTEILLLDKIQKGVAIPKESADFLRKKHLIEGRYPHIYPTAELAVKTEKTEEYLEHKAFDDAFYIQQVLSYLCLKGKASREDIRKLLKDKLSTLLSEEQKERKIGNLLSVTMRGKGLIESVGKGWNAVWCLTSAGAEMCRKNSPSCKRQCNKRSLSGV